MTTIGQALKEHPATIEYKIGEFLESRFIVTRFEITAMTVDNNTCSI